MKYDIFTKFISKIEPFPGMRIQSDLDYLGNVILRLSWTVPWEPNPLIKNTICMPLEDISERKIIEAIYMASRQILLHELDEQFKIDGKWWINPHPEIKNSKYMKLLYPRDN